MKTDVLACSLSLAVLLAACSRPDENGPEDTAPLAADDEVVRACFNTIPVKLSPQPVLRDIDVDGRMDRIDIYRGDADSEYPLVARWEVEGTDPAGDAIWASATHAVITLNPGVNVDLVRTAMSKSKLLKEESLEFTALELPRTYRLEFRLDESESKNVALIRDLLQQIPDLRTIPGVAMAEPDYLVSIDQQGVEPDDPRFASQRHLAKILAPQAWLRQRGSPSVTVAVLDSGVDAGHPDLIPNLVQGRDFLRGDNDPNDENSHGTYCSGLIGAEVDNATGIAGLNWDVSLMPLKFIDGQGCGLTSQAAEAVQFAAANGAKIISASWGGFGKSDKLKEAIANASNVLFVASAGNNDVDIDLPQQNYIPAVFGLPNMLVVGASDDQDNRLSGTARGTRNVHLSAPGDQVLSTTRRVDSPSDPYKAGRGTSPAVALVAGAAALVKAQNPSMSVSDLRCRLLKATDAVPALAGASCSGGRLNVAKAVTGNGLRTNVCGCP